MSQAKPAQARPVFVPALGWALALLVLLQFTGRTTWMLVPPAVLALAGFLPLPVAPGFFFACLPVCLLLETTGVGPEEWFDALLGAPVRRGRLGEASLIDLQSDELASILLWLAIGTCWISGFREIAHLAMAKSDPFPGPSGRTGPSPLPRSMPLAEGREWSAIGVLGLGAGILVVIIFEAAFLGEQAGYSALLRVRLASLGGGFLLVFLAVRTVTSYLHWNAMPVLEAGLVAQEAAWREGAVEMGAIHRWLTWMRVGTRRGAERRWRILSRRRAGA
ncbi:MAG: hypothetical protein KJS91_04805 [Planctomycetes bacterium]|nr:hypothetical protein [Planctomycetota bacterium]